MTSQSAQHVLIVGAGGLGCEFIKNSLRMNIASFSICDYDKVDVSNLNRQFMFQREDINKFKSEVCANIVRQWCPDREVHAYTCRIQQLSSDIFAKITLIISVLDNIEARNFINKIAIQYKIPVIEAGSAGDVGQTYLVAPSWGTMCFACRNITDTQVFPICTIQNWPKNNKQCIAWAKLLFDNVFNAEQFSGDDYIADNALVNELRNAELTDESLERVSCKLFSQLFDNNIADLMKMNSQEYKLTRLKLLPSSSHNECNDCTFKYSVNGKYTADVNSVYSDITASVADYVNDFVWSLYSLLKRRFSGPFNKDDDDVIQFVSAISNLRSYNFSIELTSLWDVKKIAGRIITALSSTNTIVAAYQSVLAQRVLKLMASQDDNTIKLSTLAEHNIGYIWIRGVSSGKHLIINEPLESPNPDCQVCQNHTTAINVVVGLAISELLLELERVLDCEVQNIYKDDELLYDIEIGIMDEYSVVTRQQFHQQVITVISLQSPKYFKIFVNEHCDGAANVIINIDNGNKSS